MGVTLVAYALLAGLLAQPAVLPVQAFHAFAPVAARGKGQRKDRDKAPDQASSDDRDETDGEGDELDDAPSKGGKGEPRCNAPIRLETKNTTLQEALEARLTAAGWDRYLEKGQLAVSVVDLTDKNRTYYAGVNDNQMIYSASLPKIAILLAVVDAVHSNTLKWTHEFDQRLQKMITASSNEDASWGTDLVGLTAIEKLMRNPRYCFYDEKYGGLWVGRAYRHSGAQNLDPKNNLSHGATARQAARFFTLLDRGKLVSPHWSFRMLGLMSPPQHHHKFVAGIGNRPGVVFMARKSGTWRTFHSDGALIQHFGRRFVLVGISDMVNGELVMRELAMMVDDLIEAGTHRKGHPKALVRR